MQIQPRPTSAGMPARAVQAASARPSTPAPARPATAPAQTVASEGSSVDARRVGQFAEGLQARLGQAAEGLGARGAAGVRAASTQATEALGRLQDALAQGSIDGEEAGRLVDGILEDLRGGLGAVAQEAEGRGERPASLDARLAGLFDGLHEQLGARDRGAHARLDQLEARVDDALAQGTFDRGTLLEGLQHLTGTRSTEARGGEDSQASRIGAFATALEERLAGAVGSAQDPSQAAAASRDLLALLERMEPADLSEVSPGRLLARAMGALRAEWSSVTGPATTSAAQRLDHSA